MNNAVTLSTLGYCAINGAPVRSRRAVEFAALLALSGGHAQRDWMADNLFESDPAPSSVPTLALRARKVGLPVHYDPFRGFYQLEEEISCDMVDLFGLLRESRTEEALDLYTGPFLPMSHSPFALSIRAAVENSVVEAVLRRADLDLMVRANHLVKHPVLSEELLRRGADTVTSSLSRSWLSSLETIG